MKSAFDAISFKSVVKVSLPFFTGLPSRASSEGQAVLICAFSRASAVGLHVVGDDIEAAEQQAGRPAGADEAGSGDADGFDEWPCYFVLGFSFKISRPSSGLATLVPRSSMIFTAFSTSVPLEA